MASVHLSEFMSIDTSPHGEFFASSEESDVLDISGISKTILLSEDYLTGKRFARHYLLPKVKGLRQELRDEVHLWRTCDQWSQIIILEGYVI